MDDHEFPEAGIDFERANAARIYDYLLGGGHNFAVDREYAAKILAANPDMQRVCQANRAYLGRVVRWCVERGVDQFLDLGSGVPTVGNVHEIAHALDPSVRVAYVDFEPVAVMHARDIVAPLSTATITAADLRAPETVLAAPGVADLLDLSRPVALLSVAVLQFIPDDDLADVLARYRAALAPGSVHALSHGSADQDDPAVGERMRAAGEGYRGSATETTLRDRAEIHRLLGGSALAEPGMVDVVHWPTAHPDVEPTGAYAAVALVRG